jgi:threonine dehydratase
MQPVEVRPRHGADDVYDDRRSDRRRDRARRDHRRRNRRGLRAMQQMRAEQQRAQGGRDENESARTRELELGHAWSLATKVPRVCDTRVPKMCLPRPISQNRGVSTSALPDSIAARANVSPFVHRTPLVTSGTLSAETGLDVRLKAELFQRTGSYKIRGPLNKLALLSEEERARGVVCSSAGNHAQGVALAARLLGIRATVCMATNATPSKIAATKSYGAEVVLHGSIWDEADEKARELVEQQGLTYVHPFDDLDLIAGQGTLGLEIVEDWPEVELVVVPIGGGGLISGVSTALKRANPEIRIVGVESADGPAMKASVDAGELVTLDRCDTIIDGLRVKRVGRHTFELVRRFVDEIVTVPDEVIFENMLWLMSRTKLVVEGAAAAPVAALRSGALAVPPGTKTACVLSGGNLDLAQLESLRWN